jgi:S-DNA-T family DNA segregation ATPase FtsK/SpoIIIE
VLVIAALASGVLWTGGSFVALVEFVWIHLVSVAQAGETSVRTVARLLGRGVQTLVQLINARLHPTFTVTGEMLRKALGSQPPEWKLEPVSEVFQGVAIPTAPSAQHSSMKAAETLQGIDTSPPSLSPVDSAAAPQPVTTAAAVRPPKQETLRLDVPSGGYKLPTLSLLADLPTRKNGRADPTDVARALEHTLLSFGVEAKVVRWEQGPVVTRFEVQPAPGVRVQKISSLTNDIALGLAAPSVRIEAPIPGKSAVGIELPNQKTSLVHIKDILVSEESQRMSGHLPVALGQDIAGHPILADLTEMPHLLIAGATGSGKSVMLNSIIASLLFRCTPSDLRFVMIDPKRVEFANYNAIPHLLTPIVTNPRAAAGTLKEMLREMEERFEHFASTGTRNIQAYNHLPDVEPLPYIVIVIDELADLMMVAPADFEDVICRLAQMTRATGIHLVVATQRPSVDVVTGLIKANIPSRIAFAVSSQVDSRTILDMPGAEKLLGKGDMLFLPIGAARPVRAQGSFVADSETRAIVEWWKAQGKPVFDQDLVTIEKRDEEEGDATDALLVDAAQVIVRAGYGSVSLLQRKMKIGYVRAARIIDQLEERGIVGPAQGSNPREVLVGPESLAALGKY